jgi:DNA-directed RNA polymerase III subunit RPC6
LTVLRYKDLSTDESLVYSVVESAGRGGAWIKSIKEKLNLHQKNVDSSLKSLINRGHIKQMKSVRYLGHKMYILAGLQPNEDATGSALFTDGVLDQELLNMLGIILEKKIGETSWKPISESADAFESDIQSSPFRKRKQPQDGFDSPREVMDKKRKQDRRKADDNALGSSGAEAEDEDNRHVRRSPNEPRRPKRIYVPYPAGYTKYSTLKDLTTFANNHPLLKLGKIPADNISQLLDVMVYDDKIIKIKPLSDATGPIMYKARKNPAQIGLQQSLENRLRSSDLGGEESARLLRDLELQSLGDGGMTEVPCGRCPVFDMCEVGGPVNPTNCEYFEQWLEKLQSTRKESVDELNW